MNLFSTHNFPSYSFYAFLQIVEAQKLEKVPQRDYVYDNETTVLYALQQRLKQLFETSVSFLCKTFACLFSRIQLFDLISPVTFSCVFDFLVMNNRTARAGAIIGVPMLRPYDFTTTSNLLFVHSFMQFQLKCVREVIFRS